VNPVFLFILYALHRVYPGSVNGYSNSEISKFRIVLKNFFFYNSKMRFKDFIESAIGSAIAQSNCTTADTYN
jgi:hypothetical protein